MSTIPTIPAPDGFEHSVLVRAALGSLPQVAAPAGFEEAVLARIDRELPVGAASAIRWWVLSAIIAISLGIAGILMFSEPEIVRVASVPVQPIEAPPDILHLPPVYVTEDVVATRWADRAKAARRTHPEGVAGY